MEDNDNNGLDSASQQTDGDTGILYEDGKPRIPTPDWRVNKPGVRDSDIYTEQTGYDEDTELTWWPGRNVAGFTIGLMHVRANVPMMPGNVSNATTFPFPMLYRELQPHNTIDVMAMEPTDDFTDAVVDIASWFELQGVSAITTNCGFFGTYQKVVSERVNVPFFSSSLMQLPMVLQSIPRNKKIAVITANGPLLKAVPAIENCGVSAEDKANRIVIEGCEESPEFSSTVMMNAPRYSPYKLEQEILEATLRATKNHDIGAIVFECTELSPHAVAIQNAVRLPVYDFTTMINYMYSAAVRRDFTGHI